MVFKWHAGKKLSTLLSHYHWCMLSWDKCTGKLKSKWGLIVYNHGMCSASVKNNKQTKDIQYIYIFRLHLGPTKSKLWWE